MNVSYSDMPYLPQYPNFDLRCLPMQLQIPKTKMKFLSTKERDNSEEFS